MDSGGKWRSGSGALQRFGYCGKLQHIRNHIVCVERSCAFYYLLVEHYGRERCGSVGSGNKQCNDNGCTGKTDCSDGE